MLVKNVSTQQKMFYGTIEELMPEEHFLRDLSKYVDFDFVYDRVETLYSKKGRPSIDPVILVKMLLVGYLYGIDSERKLEQEIKVNIAYRWFLGLELGDSVPDHSTISQLRRRKFNNTTVFQDIFDEVVLKCIEAGLVSGKLLLTDSTHILANANKKRREVIEVPIEPSEYMQKLDKEAYETGLIDKPVEYTKKPTKEVIKSITDPESGMLNRPGKPNEFCYLNHQTVDADNGIITDVHVTEGNSNDCTPHKARIERQMDRFNFCPDAVCADSAYDSSEIHVEMANQNIKTYIPKRSTTNSISENHNIEKFSYIEEKDVYICPNGKELHYSSYSKGKGIKRYRAKKKDCLSCPYRNDCCNNPKQPKRISRHLHEIERQKQYENIGTPEYYAALRLRKIWCEGNFALQKELHNLRRTRKRGIEKVTEQCLLSACALNLKRLVLCLKKRFVYLFFYSFGDLFFQPILLLILFFSFVNSPSSEEGKKNVSAYLTYSNSGNEILRFCFRCPHSK